MKKSYAKKALLLSALSIFLCVAMLAGATFAWFTDSVTSDVTTIIAGVLDIEMEHMNTSTNGTYVDANGATLFEDVEKWEPGVVTVENLRIKNVGDLALKYKLSATFKGANAVVDADGKNTGKTLADALKIAFLEGETISLPTNDKAAREAVLAKARPLGTPLKETVYEGSLLGYVESTQPTKDVAVVIYWDPTATDNDFNLQNGKTASAGTELKIDLGIKLVATQKDRETDSFDNTYDEGLTPTDGGVIVTEGGIQYLEATNGDKVLYLVPVDYASDTVDAAEGTTAIGGYSFYYNTNIKNINLPTSVKALNTRAFRGTSAENISLNEGLVTIGEQAFRDAKNIDTIVIPSTVKTIEKEAFQLSGLTSVTIPANVESISSSFRDMPSLTTVTIEGNTEIGNYAFRSCPNLTTVYIEGDDVTFTGTSMAFSLADTGNANGITIYVKNDTVAARVKAAQGSAYGYTVVVA